MSNYKKAGILMAILIIYSLNAKPQQIIINEIMSSNLSTITDIDGEYSDWIELHNKGPQSFSLAGCYLSDDINNIVKWEFPDVQISPGDYLLIWASGKNKIGENGEIHTNFKIKVTGENLFLVSYNGSTILDHVEKTKLLNDVSAGRSIENNNEWRIFTEATPGSANAPNSFIGICESPEFSHDRGYYSGSFYLTLTAVNADDQLFYTIDGSEPDQNSTLYTGAIYINMSTPFRVKVFNGDYLSGQVITKSFLFVETTSISSISLVTNHNNLWGSTGIYQYPLLDQERPVHIEYFEENGDSGFNLDAGVKIHAPDTRSQKSLRLYARARYGTKQIKYKIFDDKNIDKFKCLILRNGGNDGTELKKTQIRDMFTHNLYHQINKDYGYAAGKTVHVYINGNYWGIYNLRERQDEHYIQENFGYKKEEVDFLEFDYGEPDRIKTVCGNWNDFDNLKQFVINHNMSEISNYETMENWMDIENFIDYQCTEIFVGNTDWCNNNVKFWRPKALGGKWKWILWDTEYGLGTYKTFPVGEPSFDFVNFAFTHGGWGSGDHTWLLRNLSENQGFKQKFISRFLDLLNTAFYPTFAISEFNKAAVTIEPVIGQQIERWGSTKELWDNDVAFVKSFISERPGYIRQHLANYFEFTNASRKITLDVSNDEHGLVKINSILIDESTCGIQSNPYPWSGYYFSSIPIQLEAIPLDGYKFWNWDGISTSTNATLIVSLNEDSYIKAVFVPVDTSLPGEQEDVDDDILIYPVPANDFITITLNNYMTGQINIQICNIVGQVVFERDYNSVDDLSARIDISNLKNGVYILTATLSSGQRNTKKIIVKK